MSVRVLDGCSHGPGGAALAERERPGADVAVFDAADVAVAVKEEAMARARAFDELVEQVRRTGATDADDALVDNPAAEGEVLGAPAPPPPRDEVVATPLPPPTVASDDPADGVPGSSATPLAGAPGRLSDAMPATGSGFECEVLAGPLAGSTFVVERSMHGGLGPLLLNLSRSAWNAALRHHGAWMAMLPARVRARLALARRDGDGNDAHSTEELR